MVRIVRSARVVHRPTLVPWGVPQRGVIDDRKIADEQHAAVPLGMAIVEAASRISSDLRHFG
jgi:hypothetical protein